MEAQAIRLLVRDKLNDNDVRLGLEAAIARRHSRAATSGPIPRSNVSMRVSRLNSSCHVRNQAPITT